MSTWKEFRKSLPWRFWNMNSKFSETFYFFCFDTTFLSWSHSLWNASSNLKFYKIVMSRNNWNLRRIKQQYSTGFSNLSSVKIFTLFCSISGSNITNYESLVKKRIYRNIGSLLMQPAAPTLTNFPCFRPEYNISYAKVKVNWDRNEAKIQLRNSGSSRDRC